MKLCEHIRQFRSAAGLTQEELGSRLNISAQAISKWERGESLPDAAMLPALADALNVSLDRLFGRKSGNLEDLLESIPAYVNSRPEEERLTAIRTLALAADVLGVEAFSEYENYLLEKARKGMRDYASLLNTREEGFTIGSMRAELPFWGVFCRPEGGWEASLAPDEEYRQWFAVLSDRAALDALFALYHLPNGFSFDDRWAVEHLGILTPGETLEKLSQLKVVFQETICIDGEDVRIWFFRENSGVIALFALLNEVIFHQESFAWNSNGHKLPYFGGE